MCPHNHMWGNCWRQDRSDRIITAKVLNSLQCHSLGLLSDIPQFWLQEADKSGAKSKNQAVPLYPAGRWSSMTTVNFFKSHRELNNDLRVPQWRLCGSYCFPLRSSLLVFSQGISCELPAVTRGIATSSLNGNSVLFG